MSVEDKVLRTILKFQKAALDNTLWFDAIAELGRLFDTDSFSFQFSEKSTGAGAEIVTSGYDDKVVSEYLEHVIPFDPRIKVADRLPLNEPLFEFAFTTKQEMRKSLYYQEQLSEISE